MLALLHYSPLIAKAILSNSPLPDNLISLSKEVLNSVKIMYIRPHTFFAYQDKMMTKNATIFTSKICERGEYVKDNKTTKRKESCIIKAQQLEVDCL